ncbi:DUF6894 family protein [Methylobacterium sp. J-070]|uniref:DUF6894 family protein n=1 Tax=Methylobacterium sp. J-070 TaxID=2836650 RepID=UPI00391C263F
MFTEAGDLPGLDEGRTETARRVGALLTQHAKQIWVDEDWQMNVTDGRGRILFIIHIAAFTASAVSSSKRRDEP